MEGQRSPLLSPQDTMLSPDPPSSSGAAVGEAAVATQNPATAAPLPSTSPGPATSNHHEEAAVDGGGGGGGANGVAIDDEDYGGEYNRQRHSRSSNSVTARACQSCCGATLNGNVATVWRKRGTGKSVTIPGGRTLRLGVFPSTLQVGPDYPCTLVTFGLIIGVSTPFLILVAPNLHLAVVIAGIVLLLTTLAAFAVTAFSDPGYIPKQTREELEFQRKRMEEEGLSGTFTVCQFCNVIRTAQTTHCYDCDSCVIELDHHCPWTGHCIAKANLTPFYVFLWCVFILIAFTATSFFGWIISKATNGGPT